jgi:hypothetical protein
MQKKAVIYSWSPHKKFVLRLYHHKDENISDIVRELKIRGWNRNPAPPPPSIGMVATDFLFAEQGEGYFQDLSVAQRMKHTKDVLENWKNIPVERKKLKKNELME